MRRAWPRSGSRRFGSAPSSLQATVAVLTWCRRLRDLLLRPGKTGNQTVAKALPLLSPSALASAFSFALALCRLSRCLGLQKISAQASESKNLGTRASSGTGTCSACACSWVPEKAEFDDRFHMLQLQASPGMPTSDSCSHGSCPPAGQAMLQVY